MLLNHINKVGCAVKKMGKKTTIIFDFPSLFVARKNPVFNYCTEAYKSVPTTTVTITGRKNCK